MNARDNHTRTGLLNHLVYNQCMVLFIAISHASHTLLHCLHPSLTDLTQAVQTQGSPWDIGRAQRYRMLGWDTSLSSVFRHRVGDSA